MNKYINQQIERVFSRMLRCSVEFPHWPLCRDPAKHEFLLLLLQGENISGKKIYIYKKNTYTVNYNIISQSDLDVVSGLKETLTNSRD